MRRIAPLVLALAFATLTGAASTVPPQATASAKPWIVVSDIHYMPFGSVGRSKTPAGYGSDTNPALFDEFLAELARTEPDPPVVFITGDFLGHGFPVARAATTMAYLATRFDRVFPHAQFVMTLGNNDSACGDYQTSLDGPFLRDVARSWAPLVNRGGAAPAFVKTFAHDGSYVARLPRTGYRAVVVNDVYDTLRYRNTCGGGNPAATSLRDLERQLASGPKNARTWLVTHVPPGIDAYATTHVAHGFVVVPFLRPGAREQLVDAVGDPANRIVLVLAGHTHHFSFRLTDDAHAARDVPILIAPSVSPIFRNAPSFLSLDVRSDGIVRNVAETSYLDARWTRVGDLASQGVSAFTATQLRSYRDRLARSSSLRAAYVNLYAGGAPPEIDDRNWPIYRCAITEFSVSGLRACAGSGGLSILTGRALKLATIVGSTFFAVSVVVIVAIREGRRRAE